MLPDTVMSGDMWARCLVPPRLGDSSASAKLIMATVATKEVMACRMQAGKLGHGSQAPTPLYLDATSVLYGTATEQVPREMKYLAAKLAIVQQARVNGKIQTMISTRASNPQVSSPSRCRGGSSCTSERGSSGSREGCRHRRNASRRTRQVMTVRPKSQRRP